MLKSGGKKTKIKSIWNSRPCFLWDPYVGLVSGQRLEWTKVRTGENTNGASNFNEIKYQCEHPIEGSDQ